MARNMQKHVRYVSRIFVVLGTVYLLATSFLGVMGLLAANNRAEASDVTILPALLTGAAFLLPLALVGILHIVAGLSFQTGRKWARVTLWILSILNFGNIPVGTAIGVYTVWTLVNTHEAD